VPFVALEEWQAVNTSKHMPGNVDDRTLMLELPIKKPNVTVPVVELFLK
jgi:hypothetical protein